MIWPLSKDGLREAYLEKRLRPSADEARETGLCRVRSGEPCGDAAVWNKFKPICSMQASMCLIRFVICVVSTERAHGETWAENDDGGKLAIVMPGIVRKVVCDPHILGEQI